MTLDEILNRLQYEIEVSIKHGDAEGARNWHEKKGIIITRLQAQMIVDALTISVKEIDHKLNGTVVEDEIMGQAGVPLPEWHLDPTSLPATREDVINNMRFVMDSIDNLSARLQTIEKKML